MGCSAERTGNLPVVRYVNFKVYDPVYVAIEKGFFHTQGIEVKVIGDVLAGPTAIQAVASGAAEAGLSSTPALVNANAAGLPVVGVSDIQSALPNQALESYYVRADSDIRSVKDLVGKKFAVNLWKSSFHYTALLALEQAGVPEEQVTFVLLPFENQAQALVQRQVDVIGLMEPYNAAARAQYGDQLRLLFDAHQVFGSKQFTLHFVNRLWAKEHPKEAQAFVGGIVQAIQWIEENQKEAAAIVGKYTGIPKEYVPEYHFQPQGRVVMDDVRFWVDYLRRRGDLTANWVTPEMVATNEYSR
jgi:ABC-type nitrate/sulfonate/bicarbonate transport system substrate-binding protein